MLSRIKNRLYYYLVDKNAWIRQEYSSYVESHMEEHIRQRWKHWLLLLNLNWHYRVLRKTPARKTPAGRAPAARKRRLPYLKGPESALSNRPLPVHFANRLMSYDVVSFDIFDTLILRPFAKPQDLFMVVGKRLKEENFHQIRIDAEQRARDRAMAEKGNREVTIFDVYSVIEDLTAIPKELGVKMEFEVECQYCFANPYMQHVYRMLQEQGKKLVIASDMYLPKELMEQLLQKAGYDGYEKLYVSCDYGCSKRGKNLYRYIKQDFPDQKIAHVGDNPVSDVESAQSCGIRAYHYRNVHEIGQPYRADEMSPLVGSVYAGLVNTHLHNGSELYSPYYEYGFIYGGLYVFGFCNWIYKKAKTEGVEKILFVARDGAIYQKVFNALFHDLENEYFLWSRVANLKYTTKRNRYDFLQRVIYYQANRDTPISVVHLLESFSLGCLQIYLKDYGLQESSLVVAETIRPLERLFIDHWDEICWAYEGEKAIIKKYIQEKIGDKKKVAFVDVGWTGSGPMGLKYLIEEEFSMGCAVSCWQAGFRPHGHGTMEGMAELMAETIVPYMFSRMLNVSNFVSHQKLNKGVNNIFFEMFTQDDTPSYEGIDGSGMFRFDFPSVEDYRAIREIHAGIFDFCMSYGNTSRNDAFLCNISGHDAYMPYQMIIRDLAFVKKYFARFRSVRNLGSDVTGKNLETVASLLKRYGI